MSMRLPAQKSARQYSELIEKLQDIPTLPAVAMRVNELINDPTSSSADIAEVLKKDQVLTAKVLRLVNSSYYAIPGGVTDVQRALAFLGFNTLAQLVLGLSVFSVFSPQAPGGAPRAGDGETFPVLEFWRHALGTAVGSELLAKRRGLAKPEEAFTCGLLHDIGKLALHVIDPETLADVIRTAGARKCGFLEVERERELPTHSFLGEMIATRWGLPQAIRLCIRYHHFDVSKMGSILESVKPLIHIVRLANQICVKNRVGFSGDCSDGAITADMLAPLGLGFADLPGIEAQLENDMQSAGAFLHGYA